MDFPETPTGKQVAHGVALDMVRLNRALDSLRALAYRAGVAPLFTDEEPPRAGPWETREYLICELAEGVGRMDALRQHRTLPALPEAVRVRAELLYQDICHHGAALEQAGFIMPHENPRFIAAHYLDTTTDMNDLREYYQKPEFQRPLPAINARGAAIEPFGRTTGKAY